jgi:hypothetical protein
MNRGCFVTCFALLAGCGIEAQAPQMEDSRGPTAPMTGSFDQAGEDVAVLGFQAPKTDAAKPVAASQQTARRIIYHATLDFVVEDFSDVAQKIHDLTAKFGALLADVQLHGHSGAPRSGSWKLRVPVEQFEAFMDAARGMGELQKEQLKSEDVTEKYFDLDARLRNKKKQEARLVQLLEEKTGKLEDVLKIETEMARVREEVERFEGQLRLLDNLSALATVTLNFREVKGYVPAESAGLGTRIGRSWRSSLAGLQSAGENLTVFGVYVLPWLVVLAIPVILACYLFRRLRRRAAMMPR